MTKVSALGVEEQRVLVHCDLAPGAPPMGEAFAATLAIRVFVSDSAVQVPVGALDRGGHGWQVFVVAEGRARLRAVNVGHRNGREAEILSGLQPGEQVVLHPPDQLQDGGRVEVMAPRRQ